jgi:hypothetical protein
MQYEGDAETDKVSSVRGGIEEAERDLPRPFRSYGDEDSTEWAVDDEQIEDWAGSEPPRFNAAVAELTLQQIRVGISTAEEVSREHQRRAGRAAELANRLREAAHSAGDHGQGMKAAAF